MHLYNIFESSSFEPETIEYKGWRYVPELLVGDDVTKKVHHVFDPSGTELLSPENPFDSVDSKMYGPYGAWAAEQDFQKFVDSKHTEHAAQIAKPEPEVEEEFANEPGHFDIDPKPVRVKKTQAFDETKPVEAYGFVEEDGERKYWSREFPNYAALHLWSRRNRADVAGISNKSDTDVPAANEYVIYVDGQKKFTCATEKEAEQKLLRVKHKYPDKEFEIRQRSMVLTSALREAARVGNTYSDDVPGRTGVGISSNGGVSEAKKKTSTDKSNTQTKQELCPSCSSADVKTYSSGEKECNQCHKTWAVKDVSENCDDFHCKLRQKVKQRAASDQADMAIAQAKDPSKWLWKPGDQVYSKKTGKTYSIIGCALDRKHGAMYLYQHGEEGSDDYEQGRFIADKAHQTLVKINESAVAEAKPVAQTIDYAVWSKKSPDDQRFLKQLHPKLKITNVPRPPRPEKPKKVKPDLWKIARKAEDVWGNIFPDGDPVDYMYPYLKSLGIPIEKQFDVLNKAIKLHVDKKGYYHWLEATWDNVAKDQQMPDIVRLDNNPWRTEESVAEAGPFSYGAKKPRRGTVAHTLAQRARAQGLKHTAIEPRDQQVGVAKIITGHDLCPGCSGADIKTYSDGEKECNQCHRTWDVKGMAEAIGDQSVQQAVLDTVERLFRKNQIGDYDSLEAVRQGIKHHFSKPGATAQSAQEAVAHILDRRMRKSGRYFDLGRFKEALRQGIAHQLKKQGVAEGLTENKQHFKYLDQWEQAVIAAWANSARIEQTAPGTYAARLPNDRLVGVYNQGQGGWVESPGSADMDEQAVAEATTTGKEQLFNRGERVIVQSSITNKKYKGRIAISQEPGDQMVHVELAGKNGKFRKWPHNEPTWVSVNQITRDEQAVAEGSIKGPVKLSGPKHFRLPPERLTGAKPQPFAVWKKKVQSACPGCIFKKTGKMIHAISLVSYTTAGIYDTKENEGWIDVKRFPLPKKGVAEGKESDIDANNPEDMKYANETLADIVNSKFKGRAWFNGGSYSYLIDTKNPNIIVASDGSKIRVKSWAHGLHDYVDRWAWHELATSYPDYWETMFRPAEKIRGQGEHEYLSRMGEGQTGVLEGITDANYSNSPAWRVTYRVWGANREKPLYTRTRTVYAPSKEAANDHARRALSGDIVSVVPASADELKRVAEAKSDVLTRQSWRANESVSEHDTLGENWKKSLAAAGLAGTMALGAAGSQARVTQDTDPDINPFTGKPISTQSASPQLPGATMPNLEVQKVDQVDRNDQGKIIITHQGKQYQVKFVSRSFDDVPAGAIKSKVSLAQLGQRGMGSYIVYLLQDGTALLLNETAVRESGDAQDQTRGVTEGSDKPKDPVEKVGAYWYNWDHGTGPWRSESDARTKSKPHKPEDSYDPDDRAGVRSEGVMENAEQLDAGDDVVITGRNNVYQGKTGYIVDFGQDKRFVIVQLYNHGRHSFHSSDVSRNEYAGSEEEHDEWNDMKEASDISGLMAASHLNKQFRIAATATDNGKPFSKSYRVKAQSARVAKEKLMRYLTTGDRVLSDVELGDAVEITSGKIKEAGETRHVLYLNGKAAAHYATPQEAQRQADLVISKYPNTKVDIKPVQAGLIEGLRDPKDNPCWKGYHPVGTKKKGGRKVPNCVPKSK